MAMSHCPWFSLEAPSAAAAAAAAAVELCWSSAVFCLLVPIVLTSTGSSGAVLASGDRGVGGQLGAGSHAQHRPCCTHRCWPPCCTHRGCPPAAPTDAGPGIEPAEVEEAWEDWAVVLQTIAEVAVPVLALRTGEGEGRKHSSGELEVTNSDSSRGRAVPALTLQIRVEGGAVAHDPAPLPASRGCHP